MHNIFNNFFNFHEKKYKSIGYYTFLVILIFLLSNLPFYFLTGNLNYLPLGNNEASHLNVAKSVYSGVPPYIEHFDARGPIFFYILSICFFFDNFLLAFHLLYFLITLTSCFVCFKICDYLYSKEAALLSFLVTGLLLTQSNHAENLIFLFLSCYLYFSICKKHENKIKYIIFSGLCMSFAVLTRFNISVLALFGCFYFFFQQNNKWKNTFIYIISGLIPLVALIVIFSAYEGGLETFLNATYFYHINLTQGRPFWVGVYQLSENISTMPWVSLLAMSILCPLFFKEFNKDNLFLFLFLVLSFFATLLARKFNPHYFYVSAPFIVILGSSLIHKKIIQSNNLKALIFFIVLIPLIANNLFLKAQNFYRPDNFTYFLSTILKPHVTKNDQIFSSLNGVNLYMDKKNFLRIVDHSHYNRGYNYISLYGKNYTFIDEFENVLDNKPKFLIFDSYVKQMSIYKSIEELISTNYQIYEYYDEIKISKYRSNYKKLLRNTSVYILKD